MDQTAIQKILRNEFTWLVFAVGIFWGFITTVVLPLQSLQIQVAQIQNDLTKQNTQYDVLNTAVNVLTTSVSVLKSRVDTITKK